MKLWQWIAGIWGTLQLWLAYASEERHNGQDT